MDAPLGPPAPTSVSITAVQRVFDVAELRDLILEEVFASHHSRFAAIKDRLSCSAVSRAFRQSCRLDRLQTDHFRTAISPANLPLFVKDATTRVLIDEDDLLRTNYPVPGLPQTYYSILKKDVRFNPVLYDLLPLSTIGTKSFQYTWGTQMLIYHNDFFPSTWDGFNGRIVRNRITQLCEYHGDDVYYHDGYFDDKVVPDYEVYTDGYEGHFNAWMVQEVPREGHLAYPFFLPAAQDDGTWSDDHPLQNATSGITLKDLAAPYFRDMYLTQPPLRRLKIGLYMKGSRRWGGDEICREEDQFNLFDRDGIKIGHLIVLLAQIRNELCQRALKRGDAINYRTRNSFDSDEFSTFGWDFDGRTRIAFSPYLDRNPQSDGYPIITHEGYEVTGYRVNSLLEGPQHASGSGTIKKKFDCDEIWQGLEHAGFGWMLPFVCGADIDWAQMPYGHANELHKRGQLSLDRMAAGAGHVLKLLGTDRPHRTWFFASNGYRTDYIPVRIE